MHILFYSLIFPPDVCSNAYVFADLADELTRRGHTVTVITTTPHYGGDGSGLTPGKKPWYRCGSYHGMKTYHICVAPKKGGTATRIATFLRFHARAEGILKAEAITADVVLTQTPPPITVAPVCCRLAKRLKARSVMIVQDMWSDDLLTRGRMSPRVFRMVAALEGRLYGKLDGITTLSDYMAERVRSKVGDRVPMAIIPNPVNCELYHPVPQTAELRAKYGLTAEDFVISYVGNLGGAQDLRPLFDYARARQREGVTVLIAGNGSCEDAFRTQAEGLANVRFLGYVPRETTVELNAVSDVCTVMLEERITATSFPSKLCTVMAMGKPVALACRADCALRDYFAENDIGFSADVKDSASFIAQMDVLRQDASRRACCGENAYKATVRDFALPAVGEKYEAFFRQIEKTE